MCLPNNMGFAHAANVGITKATTLYVALLNTDTQAYPDWLRCLVDAMDASGPKIAAIASQMLRFDHPDLVDNAGDELSWYGVASKRGHCQPARDFTSAMEVFSPCAGASLYRRDFLLAMGGFDTTFFAYLEDVDLGLRGRLRGYRYLYQPSAKVLHVGHGSGIADDRYVELITKNRLMLFVKNIPLALLLRHIAKLFYGQVYFFAAYGRPRASIRGYATFFAALPAAWGQRQRNLKGTGLDHDDLNALLRTQRPRVPLRAFRKRLVVLMRKSKAGVSS
jgi:GT2 family glycosyltransferase